MPDDLNRATRLNSEFAITSNKAPASMMNLILTPDFNHPPSSIKKLSNFLLSFSVIPLG